MLAQVLLQVGDDKAIPVSPGGIIGRLRSASVWLDDPQISEAHAMVSHRGDRLMLLALRGRLAVGGRPAGEVELKPGLDVWLSPNTRLHVEDVALPDALAALEGDGLTRQALSSMNSIEIGPPPRLIPRFVGTADAWVWSDGEAWRLQVGQEVPRPIQRDESFDLGERRFTLTRMPSAAGQLAATRDSYPTALRVVLFYDTAHIYPGAGRDVVKLSGLQAKLLSELVLAGTPVPWQVLGQELWPDDVGEQQLRARLDTTTLRLRRKLKKLGIREDLVSADGCGNLEVVRLPGDRFEDRT